MFPALSKSPTIWRVTFRAQVRVAHRHLDRRVPEQLLHAPDRRAPHHQMRSERMPEDVPTDLPEPGQPASTPERMLRLVPMKQSPVRPRKDELALQVPMRLERPDHVEPERYLARSSVLRRADATPTDCTVHEEPPSTQVRIFPPEPHDLAEPEAAPEPDEDRRPPLRVRRLHEPLGFLERQEVELLGGTRTHFTGGICSTSSHSSATLNSFRSTVR